MAHPFGIPSRQIVVDGHNMDAFSGQGVQIRRQSRHQGFALTCFHFCDFAFVQHDAANQLNIEVAHFQCPQRCLSDSRKRLRQQIVKGFSPINALFKFGRLSLEFIITHGLNGRL